MLPGRLGLDAARVPHGDRHGLLWMGRGRLSAEDGTLHFVTAGTTDLPAGAYDIPYQTVSGIVLQPGSAVTHDALRLLARHGTALVAAGDDGVRMYASMPFGPDDSALARRQAAWWADPGLRLAIVRRMYAWRLGEVLPQSDIDTLRGIEGARMKVTYKRLAERFGIAWHGRRYDRQNPDGDDHANQAINHASTAVVAAAQIATALVGAIPQLGFIHEDSGVAFCLDIADLFRDSVTLPVAFAAVKACNGQPKPDIERAVRALCGKEFRRQQLVATMIDRIKMALRADTIDPKRPAPLEDMELPPTRSAHGDDGGGDP